MIYEAVLNEWIPPSIRGAKNSINDSLKLAGYKELDHDSPRWKTKRRNGFYVIWVDTDEA